VRTSFNTPLKEANALTNRLFEIGYNETNVCTLLGVNDINDVSWRFSLIYKKEKLAKNDALSLALWLFFFQGSVDTFQIDILFDKELQNILIESDIIVKVDDKFLSLLSIYPISYGFIFSDHAWPKLPHPNILDVPHDQVMYLGADTHWLARATVRKHIDSALDLCSGSGIHAILAARHAKNVVAIDINPRAIKCIDFNTSMLSISNVKSIQGDLFAQINNQKFDLITANPPFVPSPVDALGYRDGGSDGEDVQKRLVYELPKHLNVGGIAQIVTEIGERENETLIDRVRSWLKDAPMDILILHLRTRSASEYALSHADADNTYLEFLNSVDVWADNLRAQNFTHISSVLITLKWSEDKPWGKILDVPSPSGYIGDAIEAIFRAETIARSKNLNKILQSVKIKKAGIIGLLQAKQLGGDAKSKPQAQLIGAPLAMSYWLNDLELLILESLDKPLFLSELAQKLQLQQDDLIFTLKSLIQNSLIVLDF
jgi:carbamoyltransferase